MHENSQTIAREEKVKVSAPPGYPRDGCYTGGSSYPQPAKVQLTTRYRPAGQAQLDLIRASQFREFPPGLPEQSIFYPLLTEE